MVLKKKFDWKKWCSVMTFVVPALIPLTVFWIYPILRSMLLSLTDWDYMSPSYSFVGLSNYVALFKDTRFYSALWNTFVFGIGTVIPTIIGGMILALFVTESIPGGMVFLNLYYFPHGLPQRLQFQ